MNRSKFQLRLQGLVLLVLLSACSGGGIDVSVQGPVIPSIPLPSSEAITTHGAITGLGDITVNDVRYDANTASVTINGEPGTLSDLRHGQIVTVTGRINSLGQTGTAGSIRFDANLIGPVEGLDAAGGRLTVMGQTVITGTDTRFDAAIDPTTFSGLAVGSIVQVSGYPDAVGAIRAMRVEPDVATATLHVVGEVSGLDLANLVFTINGLTVDYSGAVVIDLPGGGPANGMLVKAVGASAGGLFVVERLVMAPALVARSGQRVQTAGMITRLASSIDFELDGSAASVNSGTVYFNGDAGDLTLNAELVIDGHFAAGGRIAADSVRFGQLVRDTATLVFDLRDFTEIRVPTVFNLTVTQGPDFLVEVTVDEHVTDQVAVTQTGTRLDIALTAGDGRIEVLDALVTMPVLHRIDLTGVVNATVNDFNQAQMTINVGGVSRLRGNSLSIDDLTATVSGVSLLGLGNVHPLGHANIVVSGVSQATLNMDVGSTLTGSLATGQGSGTSTLFYYGTNVNLDIATDTSSSIVRLGETRP